MTLNELELVFMRWLHLRDLGPLYATLGLIAANRMPGDPVWLMLIGPPSSGKSEILQSLSLLPEVFPTATLNEAALLSGTADSEKDTGSTGGLLKQMGGFGIIVLKDFTSVLSMPREPQRQVLAALREVYDGHWVRRLGSGGGKTLEWRGKAGLVAGCTHAIDSAHAVNSAMGERFVVCRMALLTDEDERAQASAALQRRQEEAAMRREMAGSVAAFLQGLSLPQQAVELSADEIDRLQAIAVFVARGRSAVERDPYHRDVVSVPPAEVSTRLLLSLKGLFGGLLAIGVARSAAWPLIVRIGLDSIPTQRRAILELLIHAPVLMTVGQLAAHLRCSPTAVRRTLVEMQVHGLVGCNDRPGPNADEWGLTQWARDQHDLATGTIPAGSDDLA